MKDFALAILFLAFVAFVITSAITWLLGKFLPWRRRTRLAVSAALSVTLIISLCVTALFYAPFATSPSPESAPPRWPVAPPLLSDVPEEHHLWPNPDDGSYLINKHLGFPYFPWPPPQPSAIEVIPNQMLFAHFSPATSQPFKTLGTVDDVLRRALGYGGYWEGTYYAVPEGFALVARLERIDIDGFSVSGNARFDTAYRPLNVFSISAYLRALFLAPPGYYRVIAFVITRIPFAATGSRITAATASSWIDGGANVLPRALAVRIYSTEFSCTALIYEFEKRDAGSDPTERAPGRLPAELHLIRSGIWEGLK